MPIYEYACGKCGETIEVIQPIAAPPVEIHDGCGGPMTKLVSAPTTRIKENDGMTGSTHSSILRFQENSKLAAEKKKTPAKVVDFSSQRPAGTTAAGPTSNKE